MGVGCGTAVEDALRTQVVVVRTPHRVVCGVRQVDAPRSVGGHHKGTACTVAFVEDGTHLVGVVVRRNDVGLGEATAHVHLHDVHVPVDTDAAVAVVTDRTNHAADGGAMTSSRNGVVVAARVPAVVIVHKPILVVVHAVVGNFCLIHPVVVDEVHVVVVRASSFEDRNHNARPVSSCSARGDVPCEVAVDVVVTVLHVMPLLPQLRIVGQRFAVLNRVVELSRFDARVLAK